MIDIHTHILPGIDDGAANMAQALAMARLAVDDGTTHMFATPHHTFLGKISRQDVVNCVAEFQTLLDVADIPLTILPGYEIWLYKEVFDDLDQDVAGPLGNSRYILVETAYHQYDDNDTQALLGFFERGYIPILAHPERIKPIQENLAILEPFLSKGGLTQLTAKSLTSNINSNVYKTATAMLCEGMAHIIASDAHNTHSRPPELRAACDIAAKIVGVEQAKAMVTKTPLAIVENRPV